MAYEHLDFVEGEGRNVLEAKLKAALRELRTLDANLTSVQTRCTELIEENRKLQQQPRIRPGHNPPCPAMLDSEAVCICGQ